MEMIRLSDSDVAKVVMGQSPPSSSYNSAGKGLPFFQGKADFGDQSPVPRVFCSKPVRTARPGDILISVRAPVGPTNINECESCIGRGLAAIHCLERIRPRYLFYFLRYYEPRLASTGEGSTFGAIGRKDIENIRLPVMSIPRQEDVVAVLDRVDRIRRLQQYALDMADTYLESVFLEIFGDSLKNPNTGGIEPLGKYVSYMTSGSRGWAEYYARDGDIFLRIQNVGNGRLILDDVARVNAPSNAESKRTRTRSGDLVMSITADLGRVAVIPADLPPAYINQHLALIRLNGISPIYVAAYLSSPRGKTRIAQLDREGVKSGLNFDDVRSLEIPVSSPVLQEAFVQIVTKYERLYRVQREATRQAGHLFQTLLHQAFSEEVNQ